jgi:hypothetical protein
MFNPYFEKLKKTYDNKGINYCLPATIVYEDALKDINIISLFKLYAKEHGFIIDGGFVRRRDGSDNFED